MGDFVLVRLDNKDSHVWLARALTIVDYEKTSPLYCQFRVHWWVPSRKGRASNEFIVQGLLDKTVDNAIWSYTMLYLCTVNVILYQ